MRKDGWLAKAFNPQDYMLLDPIRFRRYRRIQLYLIACIFGLFVITGLVNLLGINQVDKAYTKLYEESLVPAMLLGQISESWYENQLLIEEHFINKSQQELNRIEAEMQQEVKKIDSLTGYYQSNYNLGAEHRRLDEYLDHKKSYIELESKMLQLSRKGLKEQAHDIMLSEGNAEFRKMLKPLHQMIENDRMVGLADYLEAEEGTDQIKRISYIMMGLILLFAIIWGIRYSYLYLENML